MHLKDHDTAGWYAVAARPRMEEVACQQLTAQDYEAYLPYTQLRKRVQNQWRWVREPLFPGYLFLRVSLLTRDIGPVRSTRGVRGLVRMGAEYAPVSEQIIRQIQASEARLLAAASPDTSLVPFRPGDRVRFEGSSFSGIEGVFRLARSRDRLEILVTLLGQERCIVAPLAELASA